VVTATAVPAAAGPGAASAQSRPQSIFRGPQRGPTVGILIVITLLAFEAMAVATAMPTAMRDLHGLSYYSWAFTAFLVTSVVGIVISGDVADRIGPARPLRAGLAVFTAGLLVAGAAPSIPVFLLGRALQGFGAGVVIVAVYVVIAHTYDEAVRPKVFAALSAAWVLPSVLGPPISGLLTEQLTWRMVFLGLPPFIVAGAMLLAPALRRLPTRPAGRTGARGRAVLSAGAAGGVVALQIAGQQLRVISLLPAAIGVALLAVSLPRLLPPGTPRLRRGLPAVVAFRGLLGGAFFGADAFLPLTLTSVHGFRPSLAGVPLVTAALGWSTGSWWQGRRGLEQRHQLVRLGFTAVAVAVLGLALVALPGVNGWWAAPVWVLGGLGMGLAMSTFSVLALQFAPEGEQGFASSALQISDVLCGSLGVGVAGVVLLAVHRSGASMSAGIVAANILLASVAVVGAVAAGQARAPRG